ncbi:MAG: hypothetical protein A3C43_04250 [Candidatus Schekmanbacteria bacterium RIFCSPHIGHO2_02_FULL_38_11]|uniref:Fido domain-containing protein n=1 Tax=Candidatus Schekmanbacteria bacterium RIFCSPLOWO2_12_FULL_38_15 TaxID=1817883 RepID=A0A1F7SLN7_9BACT|nr:MAG: hypothetical protein A2043_08485 [Candidatus Schekmanbacteria bacterium GWA2_38_9]OGL50092.1 MAG: hypothetical protein A3H37_07230 [Candidatus Schekmanbacteria bacterium RIFCSPLOWO2_02_FULL_38_14]OGL50672.1 MAG: hypothetical protein A3C43_04250 [Candidatus Schekmanbacteria bacterium RIFCSPHIGHO2_02_FULL_38_11]OGL54691.1 MAG: hypothetical protein A3G31_03935 [Candidatus Schekmanbacteria bacterium RIFCSPLOWO2_12_FULL_38_15]
MEEDKAKGNKGELVIYRSKDGQSSIYVHLFENTVWLNLDQMAVLFSRDKSVISRHIKNVFYEKELNKKSVVANFATTASDGKTYHVDYYNLDVIISIGYRVKSQRGVQFRIWATKILKDYLVKGYTLNQKRIAELKGKEFKEFEEAVFLIKKIIETKQLSSSESTGLLHVITDYANTWLLLQKYDEDKLEISRKTKSLFVFEYDEAVQAINELKHNLISKKEAGNLFGIERSDGLKSILGSISQTFGGEELYPSIEEKAAHLLYFIIKDHPFTDGNKRIGSFLFIVFLARNRYLFKKNGERKFNDNALVALALLIAESAPKHKDIMIKLIMNFLVS